MADTDISKVVSLIMENPKLIEEIKGLVDKGGTDAPEAEPVAIAPTPAESEARPRRHRQELLEALKPYISDERRKAVESFVTIAEILDMMREK